MGIELTSEQLELKRQVIHWYKNFPSGKPYFYYSGAAGTGKTTVFKSIVDELGLENDEFTACAYVGKAVLVLLRNGLPATTIHSLIYLPRSTPYFELELDEDGRPEKVKKYKAGFVLKDHLPSKLKLIFLDECAMVNDKMLGELQSFGIPIVMAGDQNQLPPVTGHSSFIDSPDFVLHQIMRQEEGNPIVFLSQCILNDIPVEYGNYEGSNVIEELPFDKRLLTDHDIILCPKNGLRDDLNNRIRKDLLGREDMLPTVGDKVICRHNNWDECRNNVFLTNGLMGYLTDVDFVSLHRNIIHGTFRPDFANVQFKKLSIDAKFLTSDYKTRLNCNKMVKNMEFFEYAYAISVHLSQGSEYDRVLYIDEFFKSPEDTKRMRYTAITRARDTVTWVKPPDDGKKYFMYHRRRMSCPTWE